MVSLAHPQRGGERHLDEEVERHRDDPLLPCCSLGETTGGGVLPPSRGIGEYRYRAYPLEGGSGGAAAKEAALVRYS